MPCSAAASTSGGGTGAPPQPKQRNESSRTPVRRAVSVRSCRNVVAASVYEQRSRSDEVDGGRRRPTDLEDQRETVVQRESQAVVEAGRVADRRRHPHHVVGGDAHVGVGDAHRKLAVCSVCMMALGVASVPDVKMSSEISSASPGSRSAVDRRRDAIVVGDLIGECTVTDHDVDGRNACLGRNLLHHRTVVEAAVVAGCEDRGRSRRSEHVV